MNKSLPHLRVSTFTLINRHPTYLFRNRNPLKANATSRNCHPIPRHKRFNPRPRRMRSISRRPHSPHRRTTRFRTTSINRHPRTKGNYRTTLIRMTRLHQLKLTISTHTSLLNTRLNTLRHSLHRPKRVIRNGRIPSRRSLIVTQRHRIKTRLRTPNPVRPNPKLLNRLPTRQQDHSSHDPRRTAHNSILNQAITMLRHRT